MELQNRTVRDRAAASRRRQPFRFLSFSPHFVARPASFSLVIAQLYLDTLPFLLGGLDVKVRALLESPAPAWHSEESLA